MLRQAHYLALTFRKDSKTTTPFSPPEVSRYRPCHTGQPLTKPTVLWTLDYMDTVPMEIKTYWTRPTEFSLTMVLFFVGRYSFPIYAYIRIWDLLRGTVSDEMYVDSSSRATSEALTWWALGVHMSVSPGPCSCSWLLCVRVVRHGQPRLFFPRAPIFMFSPLTSSTASESLRALWIQPVGARHRAGHHTGQVHIRLIRESISTQRSGFVLTVWLLRRSTLRWKSLSRVMVNRSNLGARGSNQMTPRANCFRSACPKSISKVSTDTPHLDVEWSSLLLHAPGTDLV